MCANSSGQTLAFWLKTERDYRHTHLMLVNYHEIYWKQRARLQWLQEGDLNTTFFHTKATIYRRINHISQIQDEFGRWHRDPQSILRVIQQFYASQYDAPTTTIDLSLFTCISNRLTLTQCSGLTKEVTEEEIESAIHSIGTNKAPGPDGFTSKFYITFWPSIKPQIIAMVQHFFEHSQLEKPFNHTNITLIPKNQNPTKPNHFRPIGLCNVAYKVIAKILVNRLRPLLQFMISP